MNRTKLREVSVLKLTNGGYFATLMKADRLKGDIVHGLPLGNPIMAIPIHCLPGVPEGWLRDSGTYVVEVDAEHGLWFDWTDNNAFNTAIVPTVKGMNPITGMKTEDVAMHQYRDKCPVHDVTFAHDLFCEKCGYHWPPQNYVSWPSILWFDGFKQPDGTVRQFFFTEEDKRDVASTIMGKKNTIPAFGFAFYRCKNNREPAYESRVWINPNAESVGSFILCNDSNTDNNIKGFGDTYKTGTSVPPGPQGFPTLSASSSSSTSNSSSSTHISTVNYSPTSRRGFYKNSYSPSNDICSKNKKFNEENKQERFTKDVSVGAGAKIRQNLNIDLTPLEEWGQNPEAVITLYFVFSEQLEAIIEKGGVKKLESHPDGYLKDVVQVG